MAGDLQDVGVDGHDDPAGLDPDLLGGTDHDAEAARARCGAPPRGRRLNRLVPLRVSGSSGRLPHALTNASSLIGLGIGAGSEPARPVARPADAERCP